MPLTTYTSTLILTGPSRVWKYRSILTYPEMEAFPVTWTKLTCCQSLMGVCILMSDFCEIRVMLDPESIITLVRFLLRLELEQLENQGRSILEVMLGASLILQVA